VIELLPEDSPLLVGFLPSSIEIPCQQGNHSVFLTRQTLNHIRERRDNEHPYHLALVLSRLGSVVAHPSHCGSLSREPHKLDLWAWHPDDFSGVLVSLKCLAGETWVNTAFPLGSKSLRKHVRSAKLRPVGGA
jgi:hypothetical protein